MKLYWKELFGRNYFLAKYKIILLSWLRKNTLHCQNCQWLNISANSSVCTFLSRSPCLSVIHMCVCTHKPTHTCPQKKIQKWKRPHWHYSWTKGHGIRAAAASSGIEIILVSSVFENSPNECLVHFATEIRLIW